MEKVSVMRLLRTQYGITLEELADAAGVSRQYVSDIELGKYIGRYDFEQSGTPLMQKAFEVVIKRRAEQALQLSEAYAKSRDKLLVFMEVRHEL